MSRGLPGGPARRCVQPFGGLAGGGGLGGVLLGLAELGDGVGERGEADDQRGLGEGAVVAGERGGGQQPGGPAQAVPGRGAARGSGRTGARAARS